MLYLSTPYNRVIALDPISGREIWSYDPKAYEAGQVPNGTGFVHRGVAAWRDSRTHALRILMNSRNRLIELDAKSGTPVAGFGDHGSVNLLDGLQWPVNPKHYTNTSPPLVFGDLVIVGNGVADRLIYRHDPPGDVRAFDARTGRRVWTFHTVPRDGELGSETWERGIESLHRAHQCVGADDPGCDARARLPAGQHAQQRFLRRQSPGRQSVRRFAGVPRCQNRRCAAGTSSWCTTACGTTTRRDRRLLVAHSARRPAASMRWCS